MLHVLIWDWCVIKVTLHAISFKSHSHLHTHSLNHSTADFTLVINEELWSTGSQSSSAWRQLVVKVWNHFKLVKKMPCCAVSIDNFVMAMELEGLLLIEVCLELRP